MYPGSVHPHAVGLHVTPSTAYTGDTYIGTAYTGHNYIGTAHIGQTYIGTTHIGHNSRMFCEQVAQPQL